MSARHSAAVYRRRRLVFGVGVLLVAAVIVAGVWAAVAQPWRGAETSEPLPMPSPAAPADSSTPSESSPSDGADTPAPSETEPAGIVACEASNISVEAVSDAQTYAEGQLPQLSISLTNKGSVDCTINVGTSTQQFVVTSGADTWWRSTDCQQNPSDAIVTLTAGATVSSATPVQWDRTRSSVDTCAEVNRPRAPAGGASYHVAVSIGGFDSKDTRQFLLN